MMFVEDISMKMNLPVHGWYPVACALANEVPDWESHFSAKISLMLTADHKTIDEWSE